MDVRLNWCPVFVPLLLITDNTAHIYISSVWPVSGSRPSMFTVSAQYKVWYQEEGSCLARAFIVFDHVCVSMFLFFMFCYIKVLPVYWRKSIRFELNHVWLCQLVCVNSLCMLIGLRLHHSLHCTFIMPVWSECLFCAPKWTVVIADVCSQNACSKHLLFDLSSN